MLRAMALARSPSTSRSVPAGMPAATSVRNAPRIFGAWVVGGDDHPVGQASGNGRHLGAACPDPGHHRSRTHRSVARCRRVCRRPRRSPGHLACGRSRPAQPARPPCQPSVQPAAPAPCARARRGMRGWPPAARGNATPCCCSTPTACKQVHQVEAAPPGVIGTGHGPAAYAACR